MKGSALFVRFFWGVVVWGVVDTLQKMSAKTHSSEYFVFVMAQSSLKYTLTDVCQGPTKQLFAEEEQKCFFQWEVANRGLTVQFLAL